MKNFVTKLKQKFRGKSTYDDTNSSKVVEALEELNFSTFEILFPVSYIRTAVTHFYFNFNSTKLRTKIARKRLIK